MASRSDSGGTLVELYRSRIGDPSTNDEARGYWVFALGVVLGVVGIIMFVNGAPASGLRQWAIVLAAAGLVLLLAGPVIRLPLQRPATWLVYLGGLIAAVAIVWFITAFPSQWSPQSGQPSIITLYAAGILFIGIAGVVIPILTDRADLEAEVTGLQAELEDLMGSLLDTEADEDDLARVVTDLRRTVDDSVGDITDLEQIVADLRAGISDTEADEADLAAQLNALRSSQARFELYEDAGDEWRWRLRHRNGNVIADSGEGYTRRHNAQNGITSVRRNALGATLLVFEAEAELPEPAAEFEPVAEAESRASFDLYEDTGGEWRWRLQHRNGNILADSGEGYTRRNGAQRAIDRIREYIAPAEYLRPDPTAIEVYRDRAGEWRWRFVHRNGQIMADSGEGYARRNGAQRAIDRIRDGIDDMEIEEYEDDAGEHRWRLLGANGQVMADCGEGYSAASDRREAVDRVREQFPEADVVVIGRAAIEVYEAADGDYRWRLRHRNGNILADGGEGYTERNDAWAGIESVKRNAPTAPVTEADE